MAASQGQPDVSITVHRLFGEPRDFTLSYPLDPEHHNMLEQIYREFGGRGGKDGRVIEDRMHPRLPRATPDAPGGWLTIASIRDPARGANARRWRLAHWPRSGLSGPHDVPSLMHPDHAEKQEYVGLRIEEHGDGFRGVLEKSVAKRTRSDVVAFNRDGRAVATFEIQNAEESGGKVVRRDGAVLRAGIPATWFGPTESRPEWAPKVAWLGSNRREGMSRGSWTLASGRQALEMEPCRPGSRQDCPLGSRNWCGDEHPLFWPSGGTVDQVVDGILSGELERFNTGKKIIVATSADCRRWMDYYGQPKVARRAVAAAQREAAEKGISHNGSYSESKILAGMHTLGGLDECMGCGRPQADLIGELCTDCHCEYIGASPIRPVDYPVPLRLVSAARSYAELVTLWRLAQRSGEATPELVEACRLRKTEIYGMPHGAAAS